MGDVERVRLGEGRVAIEQHNLTRHAAHTQCIGSSASHHSRSDNSDFHPPFLAVQVDPAARLSTNARLGRRSCGPAWPPQVRNG